MEEIKNIKRPINSYQNKTRNSKQQKELRKKLRNTPTFHEKILWKYLRNKQMDGHKFRRQYSVGPYVVDFYCPELSLVIEVDGANHFFDKESTEYDIRRQKYIESFKIKFLRIGNDEIKNNLNGVLDGILETIRTSPNPSLERRGNVKL